MENKQLKRALFIDRDGTIAVEPPVDYQLDSFEKLEFLPSVIGSLSFIARTLDYELVMVSNQDGLGDRLVPNRDFTGPHNLIMKTLEGEGVKFDDVVIDVTFEHENKPTRKPGTALLGKYMDGSYDLEHSYVIGDRLTDIMLARNLGAQGILIASDKDEATIKLNNANLAVNTALVANNWQQITEYLRCGSRTASVTRNTAETSITVNLDLDGTGKCDISTGLGFFDHMLEQIGRHSGINLSIKTSGDLNVDEHHTIEDTAIVLGEALAQALGDKRGIDRYGFVLPMDDCLCTVALDLGGRSWLVWDTEFHREKVGDMPTEMFLHFFKSLSDAAHMNLHISARGTNEHHKIEGIFKALARALKQAIRRDAFKYELPSTKGMI